MKYQSIFLIIVFAILTTIVSAQPINDYGKLKVNGVHLTDSAENAITLRGMSMGWHNWWPRFYNASAISWMVNDWKIDIVRAAMGVDASGGYISDSTTAVNAVKAVVDAAIANGIYVIIDWHCHNTLTDKAKVFFKLMAQTYGHYPNVIYEIYNEPDDQKTWAEVKTYAEEVIDSIRVYDADNIILVGSPHWDQDIDDVADDPLTGYTNIMYTVHFYAATHKQALRDKCDYALGKGIPIFVSESAGCEASGDGAINQDEWDAWISWMETNKISWLCWSISDKTETSAALNKSASSDGSWTTSDLSATGNLYRNILRSYEYNYEPARIYKAMEKGRNGEDIVIGVLGGSITQGYAASATDKRWANLMADWWETKFPLSKVTLINAGWGGTGSDIGAHRAYDELLSKNPDFVMVEFAVNDVQGDLAVKMMEGITQQVLTSENTPGLMYLLLKQDNGTTAQASHKTVGNYYGIPMVSFADSISARVAEDGITLSSIFDDGLHPNDVGMAYIAEFIHNRLDAIYATLPESADLPLINTLLPKSLITDVYSSTYQFTNKNIVPLENTGWVNNDPGWITDKVGKQIDFKIRGNSISVIYTQTNGTTRGQMELWVDDGSKTILNSYMTDDWGTKYAYSLVQEGLNDGEHILHVRTIDASTTGGHFCEIYRVLTAGDIGSAAPIAKTSEREKLALGKSLTVFSNGSYDPDGEEISAYKWEIIEGPDGNAATITNATDSAASFTPDIAGEYKLSLTVTAGVNSSVPAYKTVQVVASNNVPVAIIGNDTTIATGKRFSLNGDLCYDDDNDALLYFWTIESKPENSAVELAATQGNVTQFKPDMEGDYKVGLVVYDSIDYSEKVIITIKAKDGYTGIESKQNKDKFYRVYPNPTTGLIHINYELEGVLRIKLYSITGSLLAEFSTEKSNHLIDFDLRNYAPAKGVYFLQIASQTKCGVEKITLY